MHRLLSILLVVIAGCGTSTGNATLLTDGMNPPPSDEVREQCALTAVRCTRCHTIERLLNARVQSPEHWQKYVTRMRLMPGSRISIADENRIVNCLVYRSFGQSGLDDLRKQGGN